MPTDEPPRRPRISLWFGAFLLLIGASAIGILQAARMPEVETVFPAGKANDQPKPVLHTTAIRTPTTPRISIGTFDENGKAITIACGTCHTTKPTNSQLKLGDKLTAFHQNLTGSHGHLTCVSCHNPTNGYDSLRLADGKNVTYPDVMTLCAQCHGTQYRDYQHGAHGGMTGFWDRTRGSQVRNNCIDCHDPHSPKYPTVQPARGPNDRFLTGGSHE